jgi:hypothetical protein
MFLFGLPLVRTKKSLKSFTLGLPLESATNPTVRQHLKTLAPPRFAMTTLRPSSTLFTELHGLIGETTEQLDIRYIPARTVADSSVFLCDALKSFRKVNIYLCFPRPRMVLIGPNRELAEDPESPLTAFLASIVSAIESEPSEVQRKYSVWKVQGWETEGQVQNATKTRLWPKAVLFDHDFDFDDEEERGDTNTEPVVVADEPDVAPVRAVDDDNWERETNLKLFGGFLSLSLESKRHRAKGSGSSK